mgnify:FL=1
MSLEFLESLETRVREAADRLVELAAENSAVKHEIEKLERVKIASAGSRGDKVAERAEKLWTKEREEIRRRLESLVEKLSALLGPK